MTFDAIILGGGPAGLQAALTLGRMHLDVLLLDSGVYRNDPADHSHNMLTRDGVPPSELRAIARDQLRAYESVQVRGTVASAVARADDGTFTVTTPDGVERARRLLLATGVRDALPAVPGLAPLFGSLAAHCPFCHGHEYAGRRVAVLGVMHAAGRALMMSRIADELVVLTDGADLDEADRRMLDEHGIAVRAEPILQIGSPNEEQRVDVQLEGGDVVEVGGILTATTFSQSAPFAEQLDLELLPSGCVEVDVFGRTSMPGVYAAGDLAHVPELPMPMSSVLTSAAAGLTAAATLLRELVVVA